MFVVRSLAETESTNDDAARLLGEPGSAGLVLSAEYQRGGRGRRGRAWVAPRGSSLLFTAILPQPIATPALWALPFWTALAVADGIAEETGLEVALQWPNDLLLEGRKCCGILCISRVNGARAWAGCGVGLNVLRPDGDRGLAALEPPPAFLSDAAAAVTREGILTGVLAAFERGLEMLRQPRDIARAWERRARLDGTAYRLLRDGDAAPFEATARRLGPDGALIVEREGAEEAVALGDARVVRY
ncbi:MAG: biotin--[acetyl-CoA-carboxylase] ligase [Candidatus Eremiobacteraeota bacterium]|nr:biotin--[acetyl-CoA-carboxylase] ligase [Candidatus Eremiobacteraeota bacterium]